MGGIGLGTVDAVRGREAWPADHLIADAPTVSAISLLDMRNFVAPLL